MADLYSIVIKENLDNQWADWFVGLTISINERNETVLTGFMTDQAELHGVLTRVRDLGLTLISVDRVHPNDETPH